jgi:hypothetical protein
MSVTARQDAGPGRLATLNPQARLAFWLSVAFAAWCLVMQAASFRSLVPPVGIVPALIFGVIAAGIARGSRRALLAAPVAAAVLLAINMPYIIKDLGDPGDVFDFVWTLVAIPVMITAGIAGWRGGRAGRGATITAS